MAAFLSNISINLLIIFQIFILLISANSAIASINSRDMLYSPLKDNFEENGFYYMSYNENSVEEVSSILGNGVSITTASIYSDEKIFYTVLPDEIFDKLDLPLSSGSKFKSSSSDGLPKLIVSANNDGIKVGNIISDANGNEYEIAAALTDQSYLLNFSGWDIDMTYEELYYPLDIEYEPNAHLYTCESQIKNLNIHNELSNDGCGVIVNYESSISEEQIQSDMKKLSEYGSVTPNKDIVRRSSALLTDDIKKMLPPVAAFGIIVLIGIISCGVITSKNMTYKLSVMYCCGASKKDCIKINSGAMLILLIIGLIAFGIAAFMLNGSSIANTYGLTFNKNNVLLTAAITALFAAISIALPGILLSKSNIYETLKNEKDG